MFLIDIEKVNAQVGPGEALTNTLIGMGTVFVVLILISVIIFLMKFIPKMFEKKTVVQTQAVQPVKQEVKKAPAPEQTQTVGAETQIAAVIMAAIASQMEEETGVPVAADGLIIRSIKKRTFN